MQLLVVEDDPDIRFILVTSLARAFPRAVLMECVDGDAVLASLRHPELAACVVRRAIDAGGVHLVGRIRAAHPTLPVLYFGREQHHPTALAKGATATMTDDAWRQAGAAVAQLLNA